MFKNKLTFAALLLATASGAQAASVNLFTRQGTQSVNQPGFATAEISTPAQFLTGSASEYRGGVGVFASAGSESRADGGDHIPQASAEGRSVDTMRVGRRDDLFELGTGVYALTVGVKVTGSVSARQSPAPNGVPMGAGASYSWGYQIGQFGGGGSIDRRVEPVFENGEFSARETEVTTGLGAGGSFGHVLIVRLDEVYSLAMQAYAFAFGASYGGGNAFGTADFGKTLRWMGVSRIQYQQANGSFVDAPDGYRLTLTSADGQFDYWNAAGPNPYNAVPEPHSWALLILGFGALGSFARLKRRVIAPHEALARR